MAINFIAKSVETIDGTKTRSISELQQRNQQYQARGNNNHGRGRRTEEPLVVDANIILATMVGMVDRWCQTGLWLRSWQDATRQLGIKHLHLYTAC